jgi:hypothetical protein
VVTVEPCAAARPCFASSESGSGLVLSESRSPVGIPRVALAQTGSKFSWSACEWGAPLPEHARLPLRTQGTRNISSNAGEEQARRFRGALLSHMEARGSACFDADWYRARHKDLASASSEQAWKHFLNSGQFEARSHRWVGAMAVEA